MFRRRHLYREPLAEIVARGSDCHICVEHLTWHERWKQGGRRDRSGLCVVCRNHDLWHAERGT